MTAGKETALAEAIRAAGLGERAAEAADLVLGVAAAPPLVDGYSGVRLLGGIEPAALERLADLAANEARRFEAALADRHRTPARLAALRAELARRNLDGFVVPLNDEYHGEYVPIRAQRLAWLTGFTGSAGVALVLRETAAVFTDGRYTLQIAAQVDPQCFETHHITEHPPAEWLARTLKAGGRVGYDPWLHTVDGLARLAEAAARAGGQLVAVEDNPLDAVWTDQPPAPLSPVQLLALAFTGEESAAKRRRIARIASEAGAEATVFTLPESIAWLLNIRGGDVPHTPLPLGFGILLSDASFTLFIDRRKIDAAVLRHLGNEVAVEEVSQFTTALDRLGRAGRAVRIDAATAGASVVQRLERAGAKLVRAEDPCLLPKACKNAVEIAGARAAHLRDGRAVARFLAWLEREAPGGRLDEMAAAERLAAFRRENEHFRDLSFSTISGSGPNGAIVHYRVTEETNRRLGPGELYLIDSGAQYLDGTTDITRTVAIGEPTADMRRHFTLVLKGHIAIATCRFPDGTTGSQLDVLARHALWQAGLDYDHGTGHGVGAYLSVHEGPQRISKIGNSVALRPGMIVSNEPGYYRTGAYGIRIENLVCVRPVAEPPAGAERKLLEFETLTRAPIDRTLVDLDLLTPDERQWVDSYHATVRGDLAPGLDAETLAWLDAATRPL